MKKILLILTCSIFIAELFGQADNRPILTFGIAPFSFEQRFDFEQKGYEPILKNELFVERYLGHKNFVVFASVAYNQNQIKDSCVGLLGFCRSRLNGIGYLKEFNYRIGIGYNFQKLKLVGFQPFLRISYLKSNIDYRAVYRWDWVWGNSQESVVRKFDYSGIDLKLGLNRKLSEQISVDICFSSDILFRRNKSLEDWNHRHGTYEHVNSYNSVGEIRFRFDINKH